MTSDIVQRLRALDDGVSRPVTILERDVCSCAADHIGRLEADNKRLQSCIDEREEALRTIANPWQNQLDRIERLEAALREIANNVDFPSGAECRAVASAALDQDAGIGCGKSVIEPWNDK